MDDFGFYTGYVIFFAGYIYITIAVLYDIIERGRGFEDDIKHDLDVLHQLGMDSKMSEINKELEIRLSGAKKDDSQDDQLFGAA